MLKELRTAPVEKITVPENRIRRIFDKQKLRKLATSIKTKLQFQPGVCVLKGDKIILVAGERRLRACELAEVDFSFCLLEEADPILLKEIELDENLNRADLEWQEEAFAKEELHLMRERERASIGGHQSLRATAKELEERGFGSSVGNLQEDLELAQYARNIPEVAQAKTKTEAKAIIKRMKESLISATYLEQATEKAIESTAIKESSNLTGEPITDEQRAHFQESSDLPPQELAEGMEEKRRLQQERMEEINRRILFGEMEEKLQIFKDGSIQMVFWDPPWGEDFDEVRRKAGNTKDYDDSLQKRDLYRDWLALLFSKMAIDSHIFIKFPIRAYSYIYHLLEQFNLDHDGIPLIWYKQGAHVQRNPDKFPGRSYEPIAFGRKGNKPLIMKGAPNVIITRPANRTISGPCPSATHPDLHLELIKRSCRPGDTIIDPMCGCGSFGVAAETYRGTLKLDWWMVERDGDFRTHAAMNVMKGYSELITDPLQSDIGAQYHHLVENEEPLPDSFEDLTPGTEMWRRFWKAHSQDEELQLRMIAFEKEWKEKDFKTIKPGTDDWRRFWREHPEKQDEMLKFKMDKGGK